MGMPIGIAVAKNRLQEKLKDKWQVTIAEESSELRVTYIGSGSFESDKLEVPSTFRGFNVEIAEPAAK